MSSPRVSIGVPVHDGEAYLDAALDSIRRQTFTDFEVIISDNCSADSTPHVARQHARADARIRYLRQPENLGAAPNFNEVFGHARGSYFKWAAHDDLLHPEYLEACVRALDSHPEAVLAFPRAEVIDGRGHTVEHYEVHLATDPSSKLRRFRDLLLTWHRCYEIFGVMRTEALRNTALLDTYWGADRTLLQELALQGPFVEVPRRLFYPRWHATQSITAMRGDNVERTYWSDARTQGRIVLPTWGVVKGNLQAIQRAVVSPSDRALLCGYVGRWALRHWKELARDLTRAGRHLAKGATASR